MKKSTKSTEIAMVETEVLAPVAKAGIVSCNALHTLVTGRAAEARRAAESACHFAVLLGLKLKEVKRETPHGEWNTLFTNSRLAKAKGEQNQNVLIFGFSEQSASNYMAAAEGAMNRPGLPSAAKRLIEALAAEPVVPEELTEVESAALDKATRGETLRQLYIDLDIIKSGATQKSGMGGNKKTPGTVPPVNSEDDLWEELVAFFDPITKLVMRGELTQLSAARLNEMEDLLRGYLDELKKVSRK